MRTKPFQATTATNKLGPELKLVEPVSEWLHHQRRSPGEVNKVTREGRGTGGGGGKGNTHTDRDDGGGGGGGSDGGGGGGGMNDHFGAHLPLLPKEGEKGKHEPKKKKE